MIEKVGPVPLADILAAQARLEGIAVRAPVARCEAAPDGITLDLKLESLQPISSFKLRPIGNAVLTKPAAALGEGIYTSSSGNSALAVAWMARRLGLAATAVVPEATPEAKLSGLRRLGAVIERLPFQDWWRAIETGGLPGRAGCYIDAVRDPAALAGDGTIGIEILEQCPDVEAIFTPFGGGGLACGIACAVRALKPSVKVIACEIETAAPFTAALAAGERVVIPFDPGFVSGVGFGQVLPEMWPMVGEMIDGAMTVSLDEIAGAIRTLAERNRVIAEGAGAIPVAAALSGRHGFKHVCAVVSGGNLDNSALAAILDGRTPG